MSDKPSLLPSSFYPQPDKDKTHFNQPSLSLQCFGISKQTEKQVERGKSQKE